MTFSTIMVCLDLERSNDVCLRIAVDLAAHFNAKLVALHSGFDSLSVT